MDQRMVEVKIISAEELKDVKHLSKMQTYAVAWIDPYVKYSTQVDKKGGIKPVWNEKFTFMVPDFVLKQPNAKLTIDLFSVSLLGDKPVGVVSVPLADILKGGTGRPNEPHFASYPVKRPSGNFQGTLHLSFRLGEKFTAEATKRGSLSPEEPLVTYPAYPAAGGFGYDNQQDEPYAPRSLPTRQEDTYAPQSLPTYPVRQEEKYAPPTYSVRDAEKYAPQSLPTYPGRQEQKYAPQYPPTDPVQGYPAAQYYPPVQQTPPQRSRVGVGVGAGLLGGALGGLLLVDLINDFDPGRGFDQ